MSPEPDWRALSDLVRHDLFRHQVSERECVIVDLLLRLSFDLGRSIAKVPRLEDFSAVTGISKGNVLGVLQRLVDKRVILAEAGGYRVVPRTVNHHWSVSPRMNLVAADKALVLLRALQSENQPELLPRDPTLRDAIAEQAIQQARAVPESGTTSFPNQEPSRSRIGNLLGTLSTTLDVNVRDTKRPTSTSTLVVENGETTNEQALRDRVLRFVGSDDWERQWNQPRYDFIFQDTHCRNALDRALRDCHSRIKDKVRVKKTRGAMLWHQFNQEREALTV
jgi:hypothetical protein